MTIGSVILSKGSHNRASPDRKAHGTGHMITLAHPHSAHGGFCRADTASRIVRSILPTLSPFDALSTLDRTFRLGSR